MSQTPPEALREMGEEFRHAARFLTETVTAADTALAKRMQHLAVCISEARGRLAYHQEEIRILPEQIGKWEAERARLESQTGLDLLRQALEPVRKCDGDHKGPLCTDKRCWLRCPDCGKGERYPAACGAVVLHPQPPGEVIEAPLTQPKPDSATDTW